MDVISSFDQQRVRCEVVFNSRIDLDYVPTFSSDIQIVNMFSL